MMPHSSVNQNTYRLKHTLGSPSWTAKPQFCVVKGMRLQLPTISFIESRTADNHANSKYRNLLKNSLVSYLPQLIHYASKLQKHKSPHLVHKRVRATMITQPFQLGKFYTFCHTMLDTGQSKIIWSMVSTSPLQSSQRS